MPMDYRKYRCDIRDQLYCAGVSAVAGAIIAWLFFRSWYAIIVVAPVYLFFHKAYAKKKIEERREAMILEFRDGMQAVSAALLAGYSMENAWREAEKELKELHGEQSIMYREFLQMNAAIKVNQPLELVLADFSERSGCEDIESFTQVFCFAKRSGGDFAGIIRTTIQRIAGKLEVEREIDAVIAGKKLEGRIMDVMPVLILLYLNLTSGDFLDVLYGNPVGAAIMTVALAVYAAAIKISEGIIDIKI